MKCGWSYPVFSGVMAVYRMAERSVRLRDVVVLVLHALAGWAYCGMLIGVGRRFLSMDATVVVHAVGAPIGFALLSFLYFKRFAWTTPLQTAVAFVAVVVAMDAFLVAPVFEGSYAMFSSALGTWIPFALIFAATYLTGQAVGRKSPE
jgi:hypothetical protein